MASEMAERFMKALQKTEETKDVSNLVELFAEGAELRRLAQVHPEKGRQGAEKFWTEYLSVFDNIHSDFHAVTEQDGRAVMEWTSEGALNTGHPVRYDGVSVIETEGGKVATFRTYYDSATFTAQGSTHTAS